MDIFKQKRYLGLVVILLVILNLITLTTLWLGRPDKPELPKDRPNPILERQRIQKLLKEELNFDEKQAKQYMRLRQEHREKIRHLNDEIRNIKKQMFDEVLRDNPEPELPDSLLALVQEKQVMVEQLTFRYFLSIKEICGPQQQKKLRFLMHDIFRGGPGEMAPPPPPKNEE